MTTFMKRNRNQISVLKRRLAARLAQEVVVKREYEFLLSHMCAEAKATIPSKVFLDSVRGRYTMKVGFYISAVNLVVKEYDRFLVFGLDISKNIEYAFNAYSIKQAFGMAHKGPGFEEKFSEELNRELNANTYDFNRGVYKNQYQYTTLYHKAFEICREAARSWFALSLKPSEFPFVSDRQVLPILVFDTETYEGYGFKNDQDLTYKRSHLNVTWGKISNDDINTACTWVPWSLCVLYDGTTVQNVE